MEDIMNTFTKEDMKAFEPEAKLGFIATVNPEGLPHITLITALRAKDETHLMWGQFTEGQSKKHVLINPKTAFAILNLDKNLWRGKALYTHNVKEGDDYVLFNNQPMFRYNSYFGIHTVHYMDLLETTGKEPLKLPTIIASSVLTMIKKKSSSTGSKDQIMKPFAVNLFNGIQTVKFISWIGSDGFPNLTPVLQAQAPDSRRLVMVPIAYGNELKEIPEGADVAVYGASFNMETCLVRGRFHRKPGLIPTAEIDLNWVYNSMPPNPGQVYPEVTLTPVTQF
jgi:hypothetical protein